LNLKGKILTLIAATIQVQDLKACEFDKTWDSFREYKGLINWDGYSYNFFGVPQTLKCWYLGHWTGGQVIFFFFSLYYFFSFCCIGRDDLSMYCYGLGIVKDPCYLGPRVCTELG
jgi:hypothetical protein